MTDPQAPNKPTQDTELREIPKWAGRYAQNRTMRVIVGLLLFTLGWAVIGGLSAWAGASWHSGNVAVGGVLMAVNLLVCVAWVWASVTNRFEGIVAAVARRLYRGEGEVKASAIQAPRARVVGRVVAIVFAACVIATVFLPPLLGIPINYLQPITALYGVPFMLYMARAQGRGGSPFMLIWPALYALHAVLVVARVPFLFNLNPGLSMLLATPGYGLIAALAAHLYSRYALRRLRNLAAPLQDSQTGGR